MSPSYETDAYREWGKYHITGELIEEGLKAFLANYHGERLEEPAKFEPQEFNFVIRHSGFDSVIKNAKTYSSEGSITEFNRDFFNLFKPILLFDREQIKRSQPSKDQGGIHRQVLWSGILEAENKTFKYSLFCFADRIPNTNRFFSVHRQYEKMGDLLFGLTDFFLQKHSNDTRPRRPYRPFYIIIDSGTENAEIRHFTGEFCRKLDGLIDEDILAAHPFASAEDQKFKELCSKLGIRGPEEERCFGQIQRCVQCAYDRSSKRQDGVIIPSFDCPYAPYVLSSGVILSSNFVQAVDGLIWDHLYCEPGPDEQNKRDVEEVINGVYGKIHNSLISSIQIYSGELEQELGDAEQRKKFVNYLIWLRMMGIAGGAEKKEENWTEYFYFPVPDLSGGYLHSVTIAVTGPIDKSLFYLIERDAAKLFQRSVLRLAAKERELTTQEVTQKNEREELERRNNSIRALNHTLKNINAFMSTHLRAYRYSRNEKYLHLFAFIATANSLARKYNQYGDARPEPIENLPIPAREFFRAVIFQCIFWLEGNFTLDDYTEDLLGYAESYIEEIDGSVDPNVLDVQWEPFIVNEKYYKDLEGLLYKHYGTQFVIPDNVKINITKSSWHLNFLMQIFSEIVGNFVSQSRDREPVNRPAFAMFLESLEDQQYAMLISAADPSQAYDRNWIECKMSVESYLQAKGSKGLGLLSIKESLKQMGVDFYVFENPEGNVFVNILALKDNNVFTKEMIL